MSVLGLDVGTSTCKGLVLSEGGRLLAKRQIPYADAVRLADGTAEIPASVFWESAVQVIQSLADAVGSADPVEALAISCHGETLIATDRAGNALTPAILSMDRRCIRESAELEQRLGKREIYRITGSMMHPQFPIPKIIWLQKHAQFRNEYSVCYYSTADYLHMKLGFPLIADQSIVSRFGGFDIHARRWSEEILEAAGIQKGQLSEPVPGGTVLGTLPSHIAEQLKLRPGVKLVAGGHDQPCAAVGMGVEDDRLIAVSAGSYECASRTTAAPLNGDEGMRYGLNSYCHVLKGRYITLAFFVSGMMSQWYLDTFCEAEKAMAQEAGVTIHDWMDARACSSPTGICVTPHIFGSMNPEWSETAAARIDGIRAEATKADLYRAVLEGASCELDLNIRVLEHLTCPAEKLRITGGGTRSETWMRLRTEITGKVIDVLEDNVDASCLGAAILAGMGIGMFDGPEDANHRIQRRVRQYVPENPQAFQAQKERFRGLHSPGLFDFPI